MKILHIIAQKPFSTGSGVYLTGLLKSFKKRGDEQYLICGIDEDDQIALKSGDLKSITVDPVIYDRDLGFNTPGMSDVMPYKATRYRDMTDDMADKYIDAFTEKIRKALKSFEPDLILCEHLYLSTAVAADMISELSDDERPVIFGFCHGSDLRQISSNDLRKSYIISGINLLDGVITTHIEQKEDIIRIFGMDEDRIHILGSGFNDDIFNSLSRQPIPERPVKLVYTGKLSFSKGVSELLDAVRILGDKEDTELTLIGGSSSEEEMAALRKKADDMDTPVRFMGILPQDQIADIYRKSHIFILPSYFEGMPLTVPEALSSGLRVVVTDLPGFRMWLKDFKDTVSFIERPSMKSIDEPTEEGKKKFISDMVKCISEQASRLSSGTENDLSHMTWDALTGRIEELFTNFSK